MINKNTTEALRHREKNEYILCELCNSVSLW